MKKLTFLLILITLTATGFLNAQNREDFFKTLPTITPETPQWAVTMYSPNPNVYEVDRLYKKYYQTHPFEKNLHTQNYKHWKWLTADFVTQEGFLRVPTQAEDADRYAELKAKSQGRTRPTGRQPALSSTSVEWCTFGPIETYKQNTLQPISTHKNVYAIDQSQSNPDLLICGTEAGGVFKSTNRGQDWTLINKGEVFVGGNEAVKIHPTNPNVFLVASNRRIYRSTDAGTTWVEEHFMNGGGYEFQFHPQNQDTVYCAGQRGLFRSFDGGSTWTQVITDRCWDIKFHPTNPNIAYLLRNNPAVPRAEFYRSNDGGITWTLLTSGWYSPADPPNATDRGGKIAVTPASPDMVYACLIGESKAGDDGWLAVYRSLNRGDTWVNPSGQEGGPYGAINGTAPWNVAAYSSGYHQGFFNFDLEVSDIDPGKIWIATIRLTESADSGRTFTSIGAANSQRLSDQHADVQDLEVNGNDIWVASDGGINYSADELNTHVSRKRGITASHFWGFNTGWNEDTYTGGRYHDGTIGWYEGYGTGNVHVFGGVEEPSGYVHPVESRKILFRTHYASPNLSVETMPEVLGGTTIEHAAIPLHPNESYFSSRSSGVYFDPRYANHLYIGRDSIIYKSEDGGVSFTALHTFPGGSVYEMVVSKSNPEVIYAVYDPPSGSNCFIYKTTDGGATWNATNSPSANTNKIEITLNPADENEVWIGLGSGGSGQKVYQSNDGGTNWNNRTFGPIGTESVQDILYQAGTNDVVYLATTNTVFYYDAATTTWIDYGLGLPLIVKSLQIRPFYRDAELRLGSSGRGVWGRKMQDTLFAPSAQPITYDEVVYCSRDTVQFDCYSELRHDGASWAWTFTPAPAYVSSLTDRNPRVVFGSNGTYSVNLTVTDANGGTDTKSIPDMVTVQSICDPDTIPGTAMETYGNGDYTQLPDLGLTAVNSLTISAWVKPNGIQPDYTGIVMNDGDAAGFNFGQGNNTLQYHWPGGAWWWNSGLIVPADEWSHVAMVATPTGMTVYVNGVASTHNVTLNPVDITGMKIGSYKGWNGRNYQGQIDEVCIWNRSLTQEEIRELRHLTKEDVIPLDPSLIAYYQFNEATTGTRVMDKIGDRHASLAGNATLELSTAPVGGGTSDRLTVSSPGTYAFPNSGAEFTFGIGHPDGELVVSRIHLLPDSLPNNNDPVEAYWIVNNYGLNTNFTAVTDFRFSPHYGVPSAAVFNDPNKVMLFKRNSNEHLNNWVEICRANTVVRTPNPYFGFDNTCGLNRFSQFFITSDDPLTAVLPADLLSFSAAKENNDRIRLNWEVNPAHSFENFRVEHSLEGSTFQELLRQPAHNGSQYQGYHEQPSAGLHYYRLLAVDADGNLVQSEIRQVRIHPSGKNPVIRVYPNPVETGVELTVSLEDGDQGRLHLYDARGKLVKDVLLTGATSKFSLANLEAGVYFYNVITPRHIRNGKLVVY